MQNIILAGVILVGYTCAASAAEKGIASYYQNPRYSGLIAAHKTLPLGTQVRVTNLDNGRSAVVKIVDRGPFILGRIIDVSTAAAGVLGFRRFGTAHVQIEDPMRDASVFSLN
ncbi:MAG TPA: septal ring lytic transglycosylase RlpA family protein [Roseiarcus sp.]|jgi:rare lipoprotein A|nr:septal ring lytic transglycosylase RlpA family protein [Roseiarcus sp.]